ncbi:hypothetical protein MRS44_017212 [Fusarium solani]|uniref:uncharacterized protein n=1 Tax=Fusarium solani TaxID=169388 RepID=UPI0032C3F27C|nr:hypothetical protein MRS44_017212 [Fusarium solani]
MAEVIGVTAAIFQLVSTCNTISKRISEIKEAPRMLLHYQERLHDIRRLVEHINENSYSRQAQDLIGQRFAAATAASVAQVLVAQHDWYTMPTHWQVFFIRHGSADRNITWEETVWDAAAAEKDYQMVMINTEAEPKGSRTVSPGRLEREAKEARQEEQRREGLRRDPYLFPERWFENSKFGFEERLVFCD